MSVASWCASRKTGFAPGALARVSAAATRSGWSQVIADGMVLGDGGQGQSGPRRAHQPQHLAPPHRLRRVD
jgi:hypothetical protein